MQAYIGAKIINAEPQAKDGQAGYRVVYPDGYVSWSPKAVFEEAYRPISDGERQAVRRGAVVRVETFYERLLAESQELEQRKEKLGNFLDGPDFSKLPVDQRELLVEQYEAMQRYAAILGQRIAALQSGQQDQRTTARQSDRPNEEIGEGVRMIGGDQSEEPVPFKG